MSNTQPLPTNPAVDEADKIIKAIEAVLVPIAENAIIAAVPSLGLPVVKQITQAIETALADKLEKMAETGITFAIVDTQTYSEDNNILDTRVALIAALKSGDKDAIQKALSNDQAAQSALVNSDGVTPAQ